MSDGNQQSPHQYHHTLDKDSDEKSKKHRSLANTLEKSKYVPSMDKLSLSFHT